MSNQHNKYKYNRFFDSPLSLAPRRVLPPHSYTTLTLLCLQLECGISLALLAPRVVGGAELS